MIVYTNKHRIPFEIDEVDYQLVSNYSWYISSDGYPVTSRHTKGNLWLHQLLMGIAPGGFEWDHKDRNKLNNRRDNLRLVTSAVNHRNRDTTSRNTSGVSGVRWSKQNRSWQADIGFNGKAKHLGYFDSFDEAVQARKKAEETIWGADR